MDTQNSLSVIESELSSALTEALVSTGLVEAEKKGLINAKYTARMYTVTIIMCSQSTGTHILLSQGRIPPLKIVSRTRGDQLSGGYWS